MKNQHEIIRNIIHGLDEKRLTAQAEPGKWSIHDNIAHLAKLQTLYLERVHKILTQEEPAIQNYLPENDPDFESWRKWDTKSLLQRLDDDRKQIYKVVTKLTDKELARIGIHDRFGRLTLVDWLESMLLHEGHHIWTIFKLAHRVEPK
ncbi:MAG: DinB family protein [Candidatus Kryptoniota bacterium]